MRMWMVDPKYMCNKHLIGEHGELHKFLPSWVKHYGIAGRIKSNSIEPMSYKIRHDQLAQEMRNRWLNHQSPLEQPDFSYLPIEHLNYRVDTRASLKLLVVRCPDCLERYLEVKFGKIRVN